MFPKNTMFKKGNIPWNKGKKGYHIHTEKHKRELSKRMKGNERAWKKGTIPWNKGLTKETDERVKKGSEKVAKSLKGRKLTKEHIKNCLKRRTPSSLEKKMLEIIVKLQLPYKFVGDGKFFIENKNPDFINCNGEKIAIEVFYTGHKRMFRESLEEWKQKRQKVFNKYGWRIIFLNETQVNEDFIKNNLNEVEV